MPPVEDHDDNHTNEDAGADIAGDIPIGRSHVNSKTEANEMKAVLKDMKDVPKNVIELKSQVKTGIVVVIFLACFLIAYSVASPPEVVPYI
mmetsp:Transcript_15901/g.30162  ORF Transcript_15901/g.30162 Transcript_15901/m.30162 type:complete len:91 (+) Transcript_15901:174-446(+)